MRGTSLKPQSSIPHILWTQDKQLHSLWANENKVLLVIAIELLACKWPALQRLNPKVLLVIKLQSSEHPDVPVALEGRPNLQKREILFVGFNDRVYCNCP